MKQTIIVTDGPLGISRTAIAGGDFPLLKLKDRLVLEIIFENLRKLETELKVEFDIVVPYAHGLDAKSPHLAPRDLFRHLTTPCTAGWHKNRGAVEEQFKNQLHQAASQFGARLLVLDQEDGFVRWSADGLNPEQTVLLFKSSQAFLSRPLTALLFNCFQKANTTSLIAKGHQVGLTPCVFRAASLTQALTTWNLYEAHSGPTCEFDISLDPKLEYLENQKFNLHYRSGRDTQLALLLNQSLDLSAMSIEELVQAYTSIQPIFKASSGRQFSINFNDRKRYWGDFKSFGPYPSFEQIISRAQVEQNLLKQKSGVDFKGKKVLEIGCGGGEISLGIKALGAQWVVGTDIQVELGSAVQRRLLSIWPDSLPKPFRVSWHNRYPQFGGGVFFVDTAGENLPFPSSSFDVVFSTQVLEHVKDPKKCMFEIRRVLKPGGVVLLHYNPYFHLVGAHGICTTDIPWGHVIMNPEELKEHIDQTEFPERGQSAYESLATYFNPERLYLADFEKIVEDLMPIQILHYFTGVQPYHSEKLTPEFVELCRQQYPEITVRDLVTNAVTLVARKF